MKTKSGRHWSELDLVDWFNRTNSDLSKALIINQQWFQWKHKDWHKIYKISCINKAPTIYSNVIDIDKEPFRNKYHAELLIYEGINFCKQLIKQGNKYWISLFKMWMRLAQMIEEFEPLFFDRHNRSCYQ